MTELTPKSHSVSITYLILLASDAFYRQRRQCQGRLFIAVFLFLGPDP